MFLNKAKAAQQPQPIENGNTAPLNMGAEAMVEAKKRSLRRQEIAIYTSFLGILTCCLMLAGSTYAWYTASAVSRVSQIKAGTLSVGIATQEANSTRTVSGVEPLAFVKKNDEDILSPASAEGNTPAPVWEPKVSYTLEPFGASNSGDIDFSYNLVLSFTEYLNDFAAQQDENGNTVSADDIAKKNLSLLNVLELSVREVGDDNDADALQTVIRFTENQFTENEEPVENENAAEQDSGVFVQTIPLQEHILEVKDEGGKVIGYAVKVPLLDADPNTDGIQPMELDAATGDGPKYSVKIAMSEKADEKYMGLTLHNIEAIVNATQIITTTDEKGAETVDVDKTTELMNEALGISQEETADETPVG